jgi:hypothetical protein
MGHSLQLIAGLLALPSLHYAADPARAFAAVVHQSNPSHNIRFRDLLSLFDGVSRQWPNGATVVLVERDAGSAPFLYMMGHLLNTTPGDYKRHLQDLEYRGEAPVLIKILNSDAAACQFVFNVPSAIAIVETESLAAPACAGIQVLRIDGKAPVDEGYRLK